MPTVLYSDNDYPDAALETALFRAAGIDLKLGQCKTERGSCSRVSDPR